MTTTNYIGIPQLDERFARYRHDPEDPSSLSHDDAWGLLEDSAGFLWVGTQGGGLNRLDPERGTFQRFFEQPAEDDDGLRWTAHINRPTRADAEIRIAVTAQGAAWFAEVPVVFLKLADEP